ncbi:cyclin-dependent kinase inhibitor 1B-like [Watersipora subatra]|uniref:cyclin-dependent kinase inhibitor 1B-like n=1 Tax=Watersipora subatra TaxID=2589382 RepID=UPI00355C5C74
MLDIRAMENWRQTNKMDIKPSAGLKKRLFDEEPKTEDHLQSDLKKEMKEIQKADRLRWNYDFTRDIPLPGGRYKWELGVNTSTPESTGCEGSGCESIDRSSESESDCSLNSPTSSTASPPLRTYVTSTVFDSPATQRRLPEFFRQMKRRASPSTSISGSKTKEPRKSQDRDNDIIPRSLFNSTSQPNCEK